MTEKITLELTLEELKLLDKNGEPGTLRDAQALASRRAYVV